MNLSELLDRIESKLQRLAQKSHRLESDLAALEKENQKLKAEIAQKETFIAALKDALSLAAKDAQPAQTDTGHPPDKTAAQINRYVLQSGDPVDGSKK
jgi:peptidoglycan hydrolase CwlO-like protein